MATPLKTSRGIYLIRPATAIETTNGLLALVVAIERADGIERIALRCAVETALLPSPDEASVERLTARIGPWLEARFEQVREAALKSIRTEHKLFELAFDAANPGPFASPVPPLSRAD